MTFDTRPLGPPVDVSHSSDVADIHLSSSRTLAVCIACRQRPDGLLDGLRVVFSGVAEFRVLDEATLAAWWTAAGFQRGHHVLEVIDGGWREELAQLEGYEVPRREWLVVTGNTCVSVMAKDAPTVQPIELPADI